MHEFGLSTAQHIREILQMLQGFFTNIHLSVPGNKASRATMVFCVVTNNKTNESISGCKTDCFSKIKIKTCPKNSFCQYYQSTAPFSSTVGWTEIFQ